MRSGACRVWDTGADYEERLKLKHLDIWVRRSLGITQRAPSQSPPR
jgi:hypothetical protein